MGGGWCATAPEIAVSVPFLGDLSLGPRDGLQKPVVWQKADTAIPGSVLVLRSRLVFQLADLTWNKKFF